jgi:hypothetical protein
MNQDIKPEQGEYSVLKIYPNGHGMAVKKVFRQFTYVAALINALG